MSKRKKPFKEKFELVGNEWKPKGPSGGWQTRQGVQLPPATEPWMENLRMWAFEMNQWAEVVNEELQELRDEIESLKGNGPPVPAREPARNR